MPSPFPGMDPYLENPSIWPDFHHRFGADLSSVLNQSLPSPYYARVEMRPEVGIVEEGQGWDLMGPILPDVLIVKHPLPSRSLPVSGGVSVASHSRAEVSAGLEVEWLRGTPYHHYFVEIRDANQGHKLITLIEILSPSNKHPGPDRRAYMAKQTEVMQSDASLIEIDLLRKGQRVYPHPEMEGYLAGLNPRIDYLISVIRAWKRHEESIGFLLFPLSLRNTLPCIPVPLREQLPEVALDLQYVFNRTYDGGPYRRGAIDYRRPPRPPLGETDARWALEILREIGVEPADSP
jgi:hypothetical protein